MPAGYRDVPPTSWVKAAVDSGIDITVLRLKSDTVTRDHHHHHATAPGPAAASRQSLDQPSGFVATVTVGRSAGLRHDRSDAPVVRRWVREGR